MWTCSFLTVILLSSSTWALWPIPKTLQTGTTPLKLSPSFRITVDVPHPPADLTSAAQRSLSHLQNDKMQRLTIDGGASDAKTIQHVKTLSSVTLNLSKGATVRSISQEAIQPIEQRSEEYVLHVPSDGSTATITANSTLGLLRGLTTFEQLWYSVNSEIYTLETPVSISDFPSYASVLVIELYVVVADVVNQPYRGFMLDTSRNL